MGYVDGRNLYQFVGADPAGTLDPMGLAPPPATQPTQFAVGPVEFTGTMELPAYDAMTKFSDPFKRLYLSRAGWGETTIDEIWVEVGDGTFEFRGSVQTKLTRLVKPPNPPKCIEVPALEGAIDAFNEKARQHEIEVQDWFKRYLSVQRTGDLASVKKAFKEARESRFGSTAEWEAQELVEMYTLLRDAYQKSKCPGTPVDDNINIDARIEYWQKVLNPNPQTKPSL